VSSPEHGVDPGPFFPTVFLFLNLATDAPEPASVSPVAPGPATVRNRDGETAPRSGLSSETRGRNKLKVEFSAIIL
jgi:hypothetical protein